MNTLNAAMKAISTKSDAYQVGFALGWSGEPEPTFGGAIGYQPNPRETITGYNDGIDAYEKARAAIAKVQA